MTTGNEPDSQNPYVGPRSFEQNESQYFFGRDEEIEILSSLVLARRVVLMFAQSGAGKSSLLRAGLVPKLIQKETIGRGRRARTYQKMGVFPIVSVGGGIPSTIENSIANVFAFSALYSLLPDIDPNQLTQLTLTQGLNLILNNEHADHKDTPETHHQMAHQLPADTPILLIFDQFEELFTKNIDSWPDRESFFRQITEALSMYPLLHVLFSMREDYIAELTPYAELLPEKLRSRFRLERLQRKAALQAVEQPAVHAGRVFDEGVAESLVDNLRRTQTGQRTPSFLRDTPTDALQDSITDPNVSSTAHDGLGAYVEPVHLQIVCQQLWANLPPGETVIMAQDVADFGDVDQALTGFYESTLTKVIAKTDVSERQLRSWFDTQAITPAHTRDLVYQGETETEGLPNQAIAVLNDAYIIRASIRGNDTWYELAHDRLVEPIWAANRAWQNSYYNPVASAMQIWLDAGRDPRKLLRGNSLKIAQQFAEANPGDILPEESEFLATSLSYLNPLSRSAQEWFDSGQDSEKLITGAPLTDAQQYALENPDIISQGEQAFLHASIRHQEAEAAAQAQSSRRRRLLTAISVAVIALFAILAWTTFNESQEANDQRAAAETAGAKAIQERDKAEAAQIQADESRKTAQASANEANEQRLIADQQRATAEVASTNAIQERDKAEAAQAQAIAEQEQAIIERDRAATAQAIADQQRAIAEAASTKAIEERDKAAQARETLVANLEAQAATATPTPTLTPTPTPTPPDLPAASGAPPTPTSTATPTPTATATVNSAATATAAQALLAEQYTIQTVEARSATAEAKSVGMVFIPGGTFSRGSDPNSDPAPDFDEQPAQAIFLSSYWIDRTEVTNADYHRCMEAGPCTSHLGGDINYQSNAEFDSYPVKFISWDQAQTYCRWLGKRLPTEAEWEKAARGSDGRIWPWGNSFQLHLTNVQESGVGGPRTRAVGSYPNGASPYGVLDMAGNIYEWTADWYKADYYQTAPASNPPGPSQEESTGEKVIRGGSFLRDSFAARAPDRNKKGLGPDFDVGFRCALSGE